MRWVVAALAFVIGVAVALIVVGALAANDSEGVALEAAKAGFQLLVLAVAGAGVTGALDRFSRQQDERRRDRDRIQDDLRRDRDRIQDERRRVNDAAVELLRDLIDSYNKLKGTRRVLRALGLPAAADAMSPREGEAFEREMRTLLEVQAAFERIGREIGVRLEEDDTPRRTRPQALLAGMESYVKEIVKEWEDHGASVASGKENAAATTAASPCLRAFLQHSRDDPNNQFRTRASQPLRDIEAFFREQLIVPILPLGDEPSAASAEQTEGASGGR
jgi:hypothetical protein